MSAVESEIAKPLEDIQNKFKNIEIGSYPFFRMGKIGVSKVMRSTKKHEIDDCSKHIVNFLLNRYKTPKIWEKKYKNQIRNK